MEAVKDALQKSVAHVNHAVISQNLEAEEHRNAAVYIGSVYKFPQRAQIQLVRSVSAMPTHSCMLISANIVLYTCKTYNQALCNLA